MHLTRKEKDFKNTERRKSGLRGLSNLLGTPETNLSGLRTRIALRVLRSSLSSLSTDPSEPPLSSELRMVMYLEPGGVGRR
jgi:hypothetical protein